MQQFWCARKNKQLGPFATRDEAVKAGAALLPKKPKHNDAFCTGYGTFGPHFDIRFTKA